MATYVRLILVALLLCGCAKAAECEQDEREECAHQWFDGMNTEEYCDCLENAGCVGTREWEMVCADDEDTDEGG